VPETPDEFWARARGALKTPPLDEWDTWPFVGEPAPRELAPPQGADRPRHGEGGIGCRECEEGLARALWFDDNWVLKPLSEPSGMPCVVLLNTRMHVDFHDLPEDLHAGLGPLLVRVQRAIYAIGDIGNVHILRIGDGSEHCHFWFMARPRGLHQLQSGFVQIWDDVLPPLPEDVWRANLEIVRNAMTGKVPRPGI
jgi:diadenosine tetraphosphate (Ap4A) HIT family hydrolase